MIPPALAAWLAKKAGKRVLFWVRAGVLAALVAGVAWAGNRITVWRASHLALQATEKALATSRTEARQCLDREAIAQQAYTEAAAEAKARAASDAAVARRVEHELQQQVAASRAWGRDLADRLQDSRACPGPAGLPADAAAAGAVSDGGEPGGAGEAGRLAAAIREAEREALAKCARDGATLSRVGPWYDEVSRPARAPAPRTPPTAD
jgi:hypothetical protein